MAAPLAFRVADDGDAMQIAEAIGRIWQEIDAALTPVVGQRGVAALFKRSLHVTSTAHPWVAARDGQAALDPAALKVLLAQQSGPDAAAGGSAFLHTFHELLATLIGGSLTERLLRSAWGPPLTDPPGQDTSR
jgi:hypothetical protein